MLLATIDRYESPETLARLADAPVVVCEIMFAAVHSDPQALTELRSGRAGVYRDTVRLRWAIIWVSRKLTHSSFPQIGRAISLDHSAVVRGYNKAKLLRRVDRSFREEADRIAAMVRTPLRVHRRALQALAA